MNDEFRPVSLVDVSARTRAGHKPFADNLSEFLDDFYLDDTVIGRQQRIEQRPELLDDEELDAWLGATGEHLAQRWNLQVPAWTRESPFLSVQAPRFYPASSKIRPILIVESPPAFRRRFLFTTAEPLVRARFPGPKALMPFLDQQAGAPLAF